MEKVPAECLGNLPAAGDQGRVCVLFPGLDHGFEERRANCGVVLGQFRPGGMGRKHSEGRRGWLYSPCLQRIRLASPHLTWKDQKRAGRLLENVVRFGVLHYYPLSSSSHLPFTFMWEAHMIKLSASRNIQGTDLMR
jgi:hypothetical protein